MRKMNSDVNTQLILKISFQEIETIIPSSEFDRIPI